MFWSAIKMSYLRDKLEKRKKILKWGALALLILILIYFRAPISRGLSAVAQKIFHPLLSGGASAGSKISNLSLLFKSKNSLEKENEDLILKLNEVSAKMAGYNTLLDENLKLKEIFGRSGDRRLTLATILAKPNRSPYDTLLIDLGKGKVSAGDIVFAYGDTPIGKIAEVYDKTSKAVLFSSPGENTEVVLSGRDVFVELTGRGGGNFEMVLPRDMEIPVGTEVHLAGLAPHVLARVVTVLSDPRDAYQKALLVSPVNIQELKFIEIEQ
ncbi:MAG: hypothetical protein AAB500_01865 [Patescibacteria group bacterium]